MVKYEEHGNVIPKFGGGASSIMEPTPSKVNHLCEAEEGQTNHFIVRDGLSLIRNSAFSNIDKNCEGLSKLFKRDCK